MNIITDQLGKKYNREWIFRSFSCEFPTGSKIAITGSNGAGKSTLLKILCNYLSPSEGTISYHTESKNDEENIQLNFSLVAPYVQIINEFTVHEMISFHKNFKKSNYSADEIAELAQLSMAINKPLIELSSGMIQRLKLSLAFYFESEIIFLDEPTTNLDIKGIDWYLKNIHEQKESQSIVIASNQLKEYTFCEQVIDIEKYKK